MNSVFKALGMSRQNFHQRLQRQLDLQEEQEQLLPIIRKIRLDHPGMGARDLYLLIRPSLMGRDRFEQFCFENGFRLETRRNFAKTTNSLGVTRFENRLIGIELTTINQAWVSDITYYRIEELFYYVTLIMDLYSRYIVGFTASENLLTVNSTLPALKMALKHRKPPAGLILHSDGGGQYYCKEFLTVTKAWGILNSMAETVYENPHAERVNGTIKNQYLKIYGPQCYAQLKQMLAKAVKMYNMEKPHSALKKLSPAEFENRKISMHGTN
jgi:putative transposase